MKYISQPRVVIGWHYEAKCLNCDADFHAKRSTAKFCSDTCRVMYHFKKVNGTLPASKKEKVKIEKPIRFKTKIDLRSFLKTTHKYSLPDIKFDSKEPTKIQLNGEQWEIKRISQDKRGYDLYQVKK